MCHPSERKVCHPPSCFELKHKQCQNEVNVQIEHIVEVQHILLYFFPRMAVDGGHRDGGCDWDGRWNHVRKFLERPGPFTHPDFEPSTEVIQKFRQFSCQS